MNKINFLNAFQSILKCVAFFQLLPLEEPILDKGVLLSLQSALNCGQKKVGLAPSPALKVFLLLKKRM